MLHRSVTGLVILSTLAFAAVGGVVVRQWFAEDDLRLVRWNPAARAYTEVHAVSRWGDFFLHAEHAVAGPTDNATALQSEAGPTGSTFTHLSSPADRRGEGPVFWVDHYRATPLVRLDQRVLGDCWTAEFRATPVLAVLACAPTLWIALRLRRLTHRRSRGFGMVTETARPAV